MSFFIKNKQLNGAKRSAQVDRKGKKRKFEPKSKKFSKNEDITSSEDEGLNQAEEDPFSSSEDENETAQEKKVRLAKIYLQEIEKEEKIRLEKDELDQSVISKRLKEDYLKETGKLRLAVADKYKEISKSEIRTLKCKQQRNCITCMCVTSDNKVVFSGSKNGYVIKYCLVTFKKLNIIPYVKENSNINNVLGHTSEILSLAVSTDSNFLAVGDKLGSVTIWDSNSLKHIKTLQGHKNSILGLSFKRESHTLFSCSKDKSVKVWNLDEMAYVETLFGHQGMVVSIDSLYKDRVVTCGGRDLRVWKIPEETQLIYNGHNNGNIDNVRLINEDHFLTGGDDGQISVWSMMRKKPLQCIENAHGINLDNQQPKWITALAALMNTDLFASGSTDGFVKLWKLEDNFKKVKEILSIKVDGVVNELTFSPDGKKLLVSLGREYKLGRWITCKNAENCILVIPFVVSN